MPNMGLSLHGLSSPQQRPSPRAAHETPKPCKSSNLPAPRPPTAPTSVRAIAHARQVLECGRPLPLSAPSALPNASRKTRSEQPSLLFPLALPTPHREISHQKSPHHNSRSERHLWATVWWGQPRSGSALMLFWLQGSPSHFSRYFPLGNPCPKMLPFSPAPPARLRSRLSSRQTLNPPLATPACRPAPWRQIRQTALRKPPSVRICADLCA